MLLVVIHAKQADAGNQADEQQSAYFHSCADGLAGFQTIEYFQCHRDAPGQRNEHPTLGDAGNNQEYFDDSAHGIVTPRLDLHSRFVPANAAPAITTEPGSIGDFSTAIRTKHIHSLLSFQMCSLLQVVPT